MENNFILYPAVLLMILTLFLYVKNYLDNTTAFKNKIVSYAKITTIDNLKLSLNKNGPCLIAFPVYNYNTQLWKPIKNETANNIQNKFDDCVEHNK